MKMTKLIYFFVFALILCGSCSKGNVNLTKYVDPFIGTGFHGHTYPGATVPFGAVQLSPDTRANNWDACSGYHYSDSTLKGFSHTHLSGTGCVDLADILFRPTTQTPDITAQTICAPTAFSHKKEKALAGYYSVFMPQEDITAELTATTHAGVHRYTYPVGKEAMLIVDLAHLLDDDYEPYETIYEATLEQTDVNELVGMRRTKGWTDNQYIYFAAQFSKPISKTDFVSNHAFVSSQTPLSGTDIQAVLTFDNTDSSPLVAKVGLSIVSVDNARENLLTEVPGYDFDAVRLGASQSWESAISSIVVDSKDKESLKTFYSALYHALVVPNTVSDVNGQYRRHNMEIGLSQDAPMYSTFSIWDTFRTWHPLMTLIDTTLVTNVINCFLDIYDASGELPIWPLSAGDTFCMIGYHSVSIIADAYLKGIRGFDAEKALQAMVTSSQKNSKGAEYYIKYGFIPSNLRKESVSCLLEFAYDDWCIARMAKEMGKDDIYNTYLLRSRNFINIFDGNTKFFRAKRIDGNWDASFNAYEPSLDYTEATPWQYRFFTPHDVNGLVQLFGGKETFVNALDSIFTVSSDLDGGFYASDITGMIGQYAHGNEPSHHIAYLYNYVGQPWKTQQMTRRLLKEMYQPTPEGICGNEDCGQMSAWYIMSALGLYPVCPGSNEFVFTTPLFEQTTIHLANGNVLTVLANDPQNNVYIGKVTFNGQEITTNYIDYDLLMEGGVLEFTLQDTPEFERGVTQEAAPYSYTIGQEVSIPFIDRDLSGFTGEVLVKLESATQDAQIRYTLNGEEPSTESPLYTGPFVINKTTTIKAKGFKDGYQPSGIMVVTATKAKQ